MANPNQNLHQQLQAIGRVTSVTGHQLVRNNEDQKRAGLVLHPEGYGKEMVPMSFLMSRRNMIAMAREILRSLDPTTEQEILEALGRIEARLQEK